MTLSLKPLDSLCESPLICGFCFCFHGFNRGIAQDISKLYIIDSYGYLYGVFWRKMRPEFAYYLHFHETRHSLSPTKGRRPAGGEPTNVGHQSSGHPTFPATFWCRPLRTFTTTT